MRATSLLRRYALTPYARTAPLALALFLALVPAGGHAQDAAVAKSRADIERISKKTSAECRRDPRAGVLCEASGYKVELRGCERDAFYAGVANEKGARLDDRIDNAEANTVANLADKQFVCVAAIAKGTPEDRYYVIAVPVASVPECKGKAICRQYGDRTIRWMQAEPSVPCRRQGAGYGPGCAAGWVDKSVLDEFSNGL